MCVVLGGTFHLYANLPRKKKRINLELVHFILSKAEGGAKGGENNTRNTFAEKRELLSCPTRPLKKGGVRKVEEEAIRLEEVCLGEDPTEK